MAEATGAEARATEARASETRVAAMVEFVLMVVFMVTTKATGTEADSGGDEATGTEATAAKARPDSPDPIVMVTQGSAIYFLTIFVCLIHSLIERLINIIIIIISHRQQCAKSNRTAVHAMSAGTGPG